jgi:hypothetical protein
MTCDSCHQEADVYSRVLTRSGFKTRCRACARPKVRPSCFNPFSDLALDHVRTSDGRPVHVSSLRQLREVEKEHRCISLVGNMDEARFDDPPQHKPQTAFDTMSQERRWLFPDVAEAMVKDMRANGEI